jgi:hypothetical protein
LWLVRDFQYWKDLEKKHDGMLLRNEKMIVIYSHSLCTTKGSANGYMESVLSRSSGGSDDNDDIREGLRFFYSYV